MSADLKSDNQPYDDINITPMLDLAYVLLVTFIILTTASVQGVRVASPETRTVSNLARPQTRAVTITADGALYLDAYPVSIEQLSALLATVAGLGVAIPSLFGYNYLASRIRNISADMQIFVDEFITRVAERYGAP